MGCVPTKSKQNITISHPFKFVHLYQLQTQSSKNKQTFVEQSFLNGPITFNKNKFYEIDSVYQLNHLSKTNNNSYQRNFKNDGYVNDDEFSRNSIGSMDYDSVTTERTMKKKYINIEELIMYLKEKKPIFL